MKTITEKIKDSARWREAEERLHAFTERMKLIEKYPIKPMLQQVHSLPYNIQEEYKYNY